MRITSNMIMNTVTRNLALSQSRFVSFQTRASRTLGDGVDLQLTDQLSSIVDADIAKVITDLASAETAYQAALASAARLIQPSLIQFLS